MAMVFHDEAGAPNDAPPDAHALDPAAHVALVSRLAAATAIAREAAALLMHHRGRLTDVAYKGAVDLVTAADKASELLVLDRLGSLFPDDRIIGEEGGGRGPEDAAFVWFVDPLDGTTNFVHGLPHFCVSLGLTARSPAVSPELSPLHPVLGVIAAPALTRIDDTMLGTLWSGGPSLGATRGSLFDPSRPTTPLAVSTVDTLSRALVATGFPYDRQLTASDLVAPILNALRRVQCIRRLGSAALDLAHLADGTFSAYWEPRLKPWDLAAGVALVRAAGGTVTDLVGGDTMLTTGNVLATNGPLHDLMLNDVMVPPSTRAPWPRP